MQVELGNTADLSCLELSRLWLEAILSYLDLSGERRGERGERGAKSVERENVEAEKVHRLYLEREGATSGNW